MREEKESLLALQIQLLQEGGPPDKGKGVDVRKWGLYMRLRKIRGKP